MNNVASKFIMVDGIRTHYLESGSGKPLVLLHSGEYGGMAELSWELNLRSLATEYRVIAPDWLGFGYTDKVFDFNGSMPRRLKHMSRFLEIMDIEKAAFVGSSMGGTILSRVASSPQSAFPIAALVLSSGGGFAPDNAARRATLEYDCTKEKMRQIVEVMFFDRRWMEDESYVSRRHELSLIPGAWECAAAARFKAPHVPRRSDFGQPDTTPYEAIEMPTLIVAGEEDPLREPGYAETLHARIPDSEIKVFPSCSHMPHIEYSVPFNSLALDFLKRRYGGDGNS